MKSLNQCHCAPSVCAAMILLAGCGNSQMLIGQPSTGEPATAKRVAYTLPAANTSTSEVLTASHVSLHSVTCSGLVFRVRFRTQGKAEGPLSGSFTAQGFWNLDGINSAGFHESFTITSGSSQVSGRMHLAGGHHPIPRMTCGRDAELSRGTMQYTTHNGYKGLAKTEIIERTDFSETLSNFQQMVRVASQRVGHVGAGLR
jgi:hypothetical protein